MYIGQFTDRATFDSDNKTAISVRDGVLEYAGAELGLEPADKMFTVYRSPATIAQAARKMVGIPLTDQHVSVTDPVTNSIGSVESADVVDFFDDATDSKLAIKNTIKVTDSLNAKELSLGYTAELEEHNVYDFEQKNIEPKHLAVVEAGRCGSACSFLDHKPNGVEKMKKKFFDAEGMPNLSEVVETAQALPEAIKALPLDKLAELMPMLREIVASVAAVDPEPEMVEDMAEEEMQDEEETETVEVEDEESEEKETVSVTDSAAFKDALKSAVSAHVSIVEKARQFVDEGYSFEGKDSAKIMRDALAVEHGSTNFTDSELPVAFKLLKKTASSLSNFADDKVCAVKQLADKEL